MRKAEVGLLSVKQTESKRFFFTYEFFIEILVSQKLNSKPDILEIRFSLKYDYSKIFVLENCRKEKFSIQNLTFWKFFISNFHCAGKRLLQNLIIFFGNFHFKLWFSMKKFATTSCLSKWARKVNNWLFSAEQIESKQYFLDVMFLSKSDSSINNELKI